LTYVTARQLFFPEELTQLTIDGRNQQSVQEFDLNNMKKFNTILNKKIFKDLIFLPHKKLKNRQINSSIKSSIKEVHLDNNIYEWGNTSEIKNILKKNYVQKYNSPLMEYLYKSKIVVCAYPETALYESILTGPTILLFNYNSVVDDRYREIFKKLSKYKIAFSNPEDAALHINNVWDNVDEWWHSKDVKNTLDEFVQQTASISKNPAKSWVEFLKEEISLIN